MCFKIVSVLTELHLSKSTWNAICGYTKLKLTFEELKCVEMIYVLESVSFIKSAQFLFTGHFVSSSQAFSFRIYSSAVWMPMNGLIPYVSVGCLCKLFIFHISDLHLLTPCWIVSMLLSFLLYAKVMLSKTAALLLVQSFEFHDKSTPGMCFVQIGVVNQKLIFPSTWQQVSLSWPLMRFISFHSGIAWTLIRGSCFGWKTKNFSMR